MMDHFWEGFEKQARGTDVLGKLFKKPKTLDYAAMNKPIAKGTASTITYGSKGAKSYNPGGQVSTKGPVQKEVYV